MHKLYFYKFRFQANLTEKRNGREQFDKKEKTETLSFFIEKKKKKNLKAFSFNGLRGSEKMVRLNFT